MHILGRSMSTSSRTLSLAFTLMTMSSTPISLQVVYCLLRTFIRVRSHQRYPMHVEHTLKSVQASFLYLKKARPNSLKDRTFLKDGIFTRPGGYIRTSCEAS